MRFYTLDKVDDEWSTESKSSMEPNVGFRLFDSQRCAKVKESRVLTEWSPKNHIFASPPFKNGVFTTVCINWYAIAVFGGTLNPPSL